MYLGSYRYAQKMLFIWKTVFFSNKYVFDTVSETNTFFQNLISWIKKRSLLVWPSGPSWSKTTEKTWWERIICTKISARILTPWCIAAQMHLLGHSGWHSHGIDWVVKRLEQPMAWLCSRVYGWIGAFHFFEHNGAKKKTRKLAAQTRNLRNKRGNSRNGVKCVFLFWIALLRASGHLLALTCCVYTSRVLHQLCFIRSWLSSSFTTDMMAIWVQTLVSSNSVRTKIALHI